MSLTVKYDNYTDYLTWSNTKGADHLLDLPDDILRALDDLFDGEMDQNGPWNPDNVWINGLITTDLSEIRDVMENHDLTIENDIKKIEEFIGNKWGAYLGYVDGEFYYLQ